MLATQLDDLRVAEAPTRHTQNYVIDFYDHIIKIFLISTKYEFQKATHWETLESSTFEYTGRGRNDYTIEQQGDFSCKHKSKTQKGVILYEILFLRKLILTIGQVRMHLTTYSIPGCIKVRNINSCYKCLNASFIY